MPSQLSLDNEVFANFAFYSIIVIFKMFVIAMWTSMKRGQVGAFATPEDCEVFYKGNNPDKRKPRVDESVERVRKNHLNDLENIPSFIFVGLFYVLIGPSPAVALWHFRAFAIGRCLHTLTYQCGMQPWRAIFYFVGMGATISMAVQVMRAVW